MCFWEARFGCFGFPSWLCSTAVVLLEFHATPCSVRVLQHRHKSQHDSNQTLVRCQPAEKPSLFLSFPFLKVITIFTLVEVVLKSEGVPLKYCALLKRPSSEK